MTQKKVLQDQKRQGKILKPPFTSMLGPLQEVSWVKTIRAYPNNLPVVDCVT
jgi:hypothetical protein